MKQITRAEWTAGLRSGKFNQIKGVLRGTQQMWGAKTQVGSCCLGVLCVLAEVPQDHTATPKGIRADRLIDESVFSFGDKENSTLSSTRIPPETPPLLSDFDLFQSWPGYPKIESLKLLHIQAPLADHLMRANDDVARFAAIADFIDGVADGSITRENCPIPSEWFAKWKPQVGA